MQIYSFGISDRGKIRDANEDYFLVNEKNGIFLVADGMGGLSNGDLASKIAVETIEYFIKHSKKEDITWPIEPEDHYSLEENRFLAAICNEKTCQSRANARQVLLSMRYQKSFKSKFLPFLWR